MKYYRFMDLDEFLQYSTGKTIRKTLKEASYQEPFEFIPENFRIDEVICLNLEFSKFARLFKETAIELFQLLDILEETLCKDIVVEFESDILPTARKCWQDSKISCSGEVSMLDSYSDATMHATRYGWYDTSKNIEWYFTNTETPSIDNYENLGVTTRPRAARYF